MSENDIEVLKKKITGKMHAIDRLSLLPKDSNIGVLFKELKKVDEPSHKTFITKYTEILKHI
jgi:hypothetical protein